tara:strand:- start:182 stop:436 length:255 start_codon:yes stop_codon:yes gene_type:complete
MKKTSNHKQTILLKEKSIKDQLILLDELFETWIEMFNNIDDVVEDIVNNYPEFESKINRSIIKKSVKKTQNLAKLLEEEKNNLK